MSEIEKLEQAIRHELPAARVSIDETVRGSQSAWLDIVYGEKWVVVEWRGEEGFGVSLLPIHPAYPGEGLFEGPDEIFADLEDAKNRILLLLDTSTERRLRRVALR